MSALGEDSNGQNAVYHDVTFSGLSNQYYTSGPIEIVLKSTTPDGYRLSRHDWVGLFLKDAVKPSDFCAMGYPEERNNSIGDEADGGTIWSVVIPSAQLPRDPKPNTEYRLWYIDDQNTIRGVSAPFLLTKTTWGSSLVVVGMAGDEEPLPEQKSSGESLVSSFVTISEGDSTEAADYEIEPVLPLLRQNYSETESKQGQEGAVGLSDTGQRDMEPLDTSNQQAVVAASDESALNLASVEPLPSPLQEGTAPVVEQPDISSLSQSVVLVDHVSQTEVRLLRKRNRDLVIKNRKLSEKLSEMKVLETSDEINSDVVSEKEEELQRLHGLLERKERQIANLESQLEDALRNYAEKQKMIAYLENKVDSLSRHSQSLAKTVQILQVLQSQSASLSQKKEVETVHPQSQHAEETPTDLQLSVTRLSPPPSPPPPPSSSPHPTPRPRKHQKPSDHTPGLDLQMNEAGLDLKGSNAYKTEDVTCPVCGLKLPAHKSQYAITLHVEGCLKERGYS